ncbi:MAG: 23S rRNA (cytosine(1962)-C(5))-methyltransferase RlmI, partial [Ignavibacterium sp.]
MPVVILKKGKERLVHSKHPWIFSGAIEKIENVKQNGETVVVKSFDGNELALGAISLHSQIAVRIWSFDVNQKIDEDYFAERIQSAIELRNKIINYDQTNVYRLINSESDLIPGLITDVYSDFAVCQFLSAGAEFWKYKIVEILKQKLNLQNIYERSDTDSRR